MKDISYITNSSPAFIENLYRDYIKDPESVDPDMKRFFEGFDFAVENLNNNANGETANGEGANGAHAAVAVTMPAHGKKEIPSPESIDWMREIMAYRMFLGYRNKGHLLAKTNPIRTRKDRGANIELGFY